MNEQNEVQLVYWGARLSRDADLEPAHTHGGYAFESDAGLAPIEYPGWGGLRFAEPCLKVTFADGVRDLVLKYASHEVQGDRLVLHLKDIGYGLGVDLAYRVFPRHDIVAKQATIRNGTPGAVVLESAASGVWHMPFRLPNDRTYRLTHLAGRWASETQIVRETIEPGKKVLESRRGTTSHQANPFFAIDEDGRADEEHGRVWFGALAWSGNWKITVERTPEGLVRVIGGFNDFDFGYRLAPGGALDDASLLRRLHEGRLRRGLATPARAAGRGDPARPRRAEACGPSSTTPGRRPSSPSTSRARRRSPRRRRSSASSGSSWTTAGSARATTTAPASATGPSTARSSRTASSPSSTT